MEKSVFFVEKFGRKVCYLSIILGEKCIFTSKYREKSV